MQEISNSYKELINNNYSLSPKVKIVLNNVEYLGNVVKTFPKISHSSNFVGSFPIKKVSFDIYNLNNDLDFENKEFEVYKGIVINENIEWVKQGIFKATSDNITNNITTHVMTIDNAQDRTILFDSKYESSLDWSNEQTHTGLEIVQEICNRKNIALKSLDFAWANYYFKQPNFAENTSDREVISRIAEIGGEIAFIDSNGGLVIKKQIKTNDIISRKRYEKLACEKKIEFNTVVLGTDGIDNDIVFPEEVNGERVEFKILDNPFVDLYKEEMIEQVASYIVGLSYTPFELSGFVDGFIYELNDVVTIVDKNGNSFDSVILDYSNSSRIKSTIKADVITKNTTNYNIAGSSKRDINNVKFQVNNIDQKITAVAATQDEQSRKISQITQTVNKIKSEISEVADITISSDGYGKVSLSNINESEPIYIRVYPTSNQDISYLYPRDNLYPSDDLFLQGRTLRFTNITTNEIVEYELPNDLLYYDDNNYDEFILDYDAQTCEVNKKVGYKEDGTKYLLENPQTISYPYPNIHLLAGDYVTSMPGYDDVYMFVRMMVQNIYTDQFATKMELNSSITQTAESITSQVSAIYATKNELNSTITQTANEINLQVSKKVGNDEIISRINQSPEEVTIQANKVNINGVINAINNDASTTIDGDKITTGSITASQVASDVITTKNFSAQKISADNITSGTISTSRLSTDVITTSNFSAQSINANKISSGTLTSANINIDNGTGALKMLKGDKNHPSVSAINICSYADSPSSKGAGLSFRSGKNVDSLGSQIGYISYGSSGGAKYYSTANMNIESGNSFGLDSNGFLRISAGASDLSSSASGSIYMTASNHINLRTNGSVYAQGNSLASSKVLTDAGSSSSRSVKKNLIEFNQDKYNKALSLLRNMKLYDYDYKYDLYKDKKQYGFIIDEIEELDKEQEFFKIEENEAIVNDEHLNFNIDDKKDNDEIIKVKKYDPNTLDKYLLTVCKALCEKVEKLEKELEEMKK